MDVKRNVTNFVFTARGNVFIYLFIYLFCLFCLFVSCCAYGVVGEAGLTMEMKVSQIK